MDMPPFKKRNHIHSRFLRKKFGAAKINESKTTGRKQYDQPLDNYR